MPTNETFIMLGLGAAALWFLNRGGSEENQVVQLTGAAMMASGEGTSPDAPFQTYSAPTNPIFFFNQGGEMAQIPGTNVPLAASSGEDIGVYPGGGNKPELEFTVARSVPPAGTSDVSPTTPNFAGTIPAKVTPSTIWDEQAQIADANFMPLLAISSISKSGIDILGSNVDISTLSSKEHFRAVNPGGFAFTTTGEVLGQFVKGVAGTLDGPVTNPVVVSQTPTSYNTSVPVWAGGNNWWDEG